MSSLAHHIHHAYFNPDASAWAHQHDSGDGSRTFLTQPSSVRSTLTTTRAQEGTIYTQTLSQLNPAHQTNSPAYTNLPTQSQTAAADMPPLAPNQMIINRTTFVAALTVSGIITLTSLLALALILYRTWTRRRESQLQEAEARAWGRKSRFEKRLSEMRRQIDEQYARKDPAASSSEDVFAKEVMMKEAGGGRQTSPAELMMSEKVCEVPAIAVPDRAAEEGRGRTWSTARRLTLFFDQGLGIWLPRR